MIHNFSPISPLKPQSSPCHVLVRRTSSAQRMHESVRRSSVRIEDNERRTISRYSCKSGDSCENNITNIVLLPTARTITKLHHTDHMMRARQVSVPTVGVALRCQVTQRGRFGRFVCRGVFRARWQYRTWYAQGDEVKRGAGLRESLGIIL
jgi:hypothetical protein